jgi:ABC-type transport system substrate-binding protein
MGVELAEAVAADLKKVGIEAAIDVIEWGTMVTYWAGLPPEKNPQEIFIMGAGASTADADWGLRPISSERPDQREQLRLLLECGVRRAIEAAMRETDAGKRQAPTASADRVPRGPGAVWLFDTLYVVASRSNVGGVTPSPLGAVTFQQATVR